MSFAGFKKLEHYLFSQALGVDSVLVTWFMHYLYFIYMRALMNLLFIIIMNFRNYVL